MSIISSLGQRTACLAQTEGGDFPPDEAFDLGELFKDPEVLAVEVGSGLERGQEGWGTAAERVIADRSVTIMSSGQQRLARVLNSHVFRLAQTADEAFRQESGPEFEVRKRVGALAGYTEALARTSLPGTWLPDELGTGADVVLPGIVAEHFLAAGMDPEDRGVSHTRLSGRLQSMYAEWRSPGHIYKTAATLALLAIAVYDASARGIGAFNGKARPDWRFQVGRMIYAMGPTFHQSFATFLTEEVGSGIRIHDDFERARYLQVLSRLHGVAGSLSKNESDAAGRLTALIVKAHSVVATLDPERDIPFSAIASHDLGLTEALAVPEVSAAVASIRSVDGWGTSDPKNFALAVARALWDPAKLAEDGLKAPDRIIDAVRILNGDSSRHFLRAIGAEAPAAAPQPKPKGPSLAQRMGRWVSERGSRIAASATGFAVAGPLAEGLVLHAPWTDGSRLGWFVPWGRIGNAPLNNLSVELGWTMAGASVAAGVLDVYFGAAEDRFAGRRAEASGAGRWGYGLALWGARAARRTAPLAAMLGGLQLALHRSGLSDYGAAPSFGYAAAASLVGGAAVSAMRHLSGIGSVAGAPRRFHALTSVAGRTAALGLGRVLRFI